MERVVGILCVWNETLNSGRIVGYGNLWEAVELLHYEALYEGFDAALQYSSTSRRYMLCPVTRPPTSICAGQLRLCSLTASLPLINGSSDLLIASTDFSSL